MKRSELHRLETIRYNKTVGSYHDILKCEILGQVKWNQSQNDSRRISIYSKNFIIVQFKIVLCEEVIYANDL